MTMTSLGDLAQSVMLRQQNLRIRQDMNRLSQEVATGITSDTAQRVKGDFRYIASIERNLETVQAYRDTASEAGAFAAGMQTALESLQQISAEVAPTFLANVNGGLSMQQALTGTVAQDSWRQITSIMNTRLAGRSLFAGNTTDQPALADAGVIQQALLSNIGTETTTNGILSLIDQWFDIPGGGFDTVAYLGAPTGLAPHRLEATVQVNLDVRADSLAMRNMLKQTATAMIATDSSLSLSDETRQALLYQAGQGLYQNQEEMTQLQADLGFAESKIEDNAVRLASEKTSLELARTALLSVDPFDTASQLAEAQSRLETLYAITARMSRLSLTEFLR